MRLSGLVLRGKKRPDCRIANFLRDCGVRVSSVWVSTKFAVPGDEILGLREELRR